MPRIDADETLRVEAVFPDMLLQADGYQFQCELDGWKYLRNAMVRADQPWRWEGVLHEYLTQDAPHRWDALPQATIVVSRDGARARAGDVLFVDESVHAWRALDELVMSAYYVGAIEQGRAALARLIEERRFPEHERARIEGNRQYFGL